MPVWRVAALAGYPAIIIIALVLGQPQWRALAMPLLAIALVGPWPASLPGRALLVLTLGLALAVIAWPSLALWPPGLICLSFAAWFGVSLLPGRRPRIQQFATLALEAHQEHLPVDSDRWLRGWTWLWTLALTAFALVALLLAWQDRASLWLLWVVAGMPVLMITLLLGEHYLRRWRFPEQPRWSALYFLRTVARIQPGHLKP
ncbi:hypothetical protein WM2015_3007 [Wenzhouxiangella marina]|uniref:Ketosynthase n=2 Tax=Wenzhouxiangella marina TaxID=1579979 RepID=A0A0K0Y0B4_9GAMM|nr:hypothetical protein WM2015_3007 [Wenzhouxiangella marina]